MFHCPEGVWVIEQRAIMYSATVRSPTVSLTIVFAQPFIQVQIKENIKAPRQWSLCGEFTGDRWIPRTNDQ